MPDLDLGPDDYRKQDPKSGRWYLPDDPRVAWILGALSVAALVYIYLNRDEMSSGSLFGAVALFAAGAGFMIREITKNIH